MRPAPLALALIVPLAGCAGRVEYLPVSPWLIPSPPNLPAVGAAELSCLTDDAYSRLAERDRARADYTAQLRALLGADRGRHE